MNEYLVSPTSRFLPVQGSAGGGTVDLTPFLAALNRPLKLIAERLGISDGTGGTPTLYADLTARDNRLTNVGDAVNPQDAVNLRFADDRYVQQASGLLELVVLGAVGGINLDVGSTSVTGSATVTTRLGQVNYAIGCVQDDPSISLYPGVSVTPSGRSVVLKTWKPTSSSDPTPIAATDAYTVHWVAFGPDLSGGAAVAGASSPSTPSGSGSSGSSGGGTSSTLGISRTF